MKGYQSPILWKVDLRGGELSDAEEMLKGGPSSTKISFGRNEASPEIWLDFGNKVAGFPFVELESASGGGRLNIVYGPTRDSMFYRHSMPLPAAGGLAVDDTFVALRFMKVSVSFDSPFPYSYTVRIKRIGIRDSSYPANEEGGFSSGEPLLDGVWRTGAYTVRLCMQPNEHSYAFSYTLPPKKKAFPNEWRNPYSKYVIWDGPRRDREAWIGDVRTEALIIHSAFGAYEVTKSTLALFYDLQNSAGLVPGSAISGQDFKEYNLWWLATAWECYLFSGDKTFLAYLYPGIRRLLDWIFYSVDERGFLYNDKGWMWTFPREGYNGATQCVLAFALECAAKIEEAMGSPANAEACLALREKLIGCVNETFWDEERGVYFDTIHLANQDTFIPSDINVYAVAFGVADGQRATRVLRYLKANMWNDFGSTTIDRKIEGARFTAEHKSRLAMYFGDIRDEDTDAILGTHNKQIWPFIVAYEVEAHFLAGNPDDALDLIERCWGNMLRQEPGTFWEFAEGDTGKFSTKVILEGGRHDMMGSACHGWSGWVSYLMQAYILGIKPARPGFSEIAISPRTGRLNDVSGSVPTPLGTIRVRIEKTDSVYRVYVDCPSSIEARIEAAPEELKGRSLEIVRMT